MDSLGAWWTTLLYVGEWLIRIVMLIVVPLRRNPEAAKGWLLLILFMPWAGLILYLVIGRPRLPRWRMTMLGRLAHALDPLRQRLRKDPHASRPPLEPTLAHAATLAENLGLLRPMGGNAAELLADYDATISRLVADIDSATHHVHLLFYIFADDEVGRRVIEALKRAAARGVRCRVLIDTMGSRPWSRRVRASLTAASVEVHEVLPVGLFRRKAGRIDLRNHRKIAVIDGRVAYTGSQNLVSAVFKQGITYEELVVRLTGPVVLHLQVVFVADWFLETGEFLDSADVFPDPAVTGTVTAHCLPSGPMYSTSNVQRLVVAMVHGARKSVVIVTPYFIPDEALLQAMQTAVLRGVDVHLVVSKVADQVLVSLAQRSYYEELLENGVKVHVYGEKFLHAKHVTVDEDLALIGSSNMDIRSFVLNEEVSLLFYDRGVAEELKAHHQRYFAGSELLDPGEWHERPFLRRTAQSLARLLSPLL